LDVQEGEKSGKRLKIDLENPPVEVEKKISKVNRKKLKREENYRVSFT
jgi:hypothetical protein